jgi:hypothetical protein
LDAGARQVRNGLGQRLVQTLAGGRDLDAEKRAADPVVGLGVVAGGVEIRVDVGQEAAFISRP